MWGYLAHKLFIIDPLPGLFMVIFYTKCFKVDSLIFYIYIFIINNSSLFSSFSVSYTSYLYFRRIILNNELYFCLVLDFAFGVPLLNFTLPFGLGWTFFII